MTAFPAYEKTPLADGTVKETLIGSKVTLAAGLSGWLLTGIGYSSEIAAQGLKQSDAVLSGIFNISTLIPAVGFGLLAIVLWFWYPLHKKQVEENIALLKEKHNQ